MKHLLAPKIYQNPTIVPDFQSWVSDTFMLERGQPLGQKPRVFLQLKTAATVTMFKTLKTDYFQMWHLFKIDLHLKTLSKLNTFKPRKTTISSTLLIR